MGGNIPGSVRDMLFCVKSFSASFSAGCEAIVLLLSLFVKLRERRRPDEVYLQSDVAGCLLKQLRQLPYSDIRRMRDTVQNTVRVESTTTQRQYSPSTDGNVCSRGKNFEHAFATHTNNIASVPMHDSHGKTETDLNMTVCSIQTLVNASEQEYSKLKHY
ncbi:uncharacterized protein LAESUDRAFT_199939 [Laetiporus sulphureus 93-53]|uniref:Uncharacterized protein n=1 Tax=Laetiporus sulphureus 93-53 TaxID=1314785 RepID=A0A165E365_9APHY|nr:uncharacterized protein LAESUDRAFT_199939 [Laetiporus sulphureus 93-53]KZT06154.1 hypothetical protein LAESUDRAFT_199939 [Laetiporus sulphureus 93-53]